MPLARVTSFVVVAFAIGCGGGSELDLTPVSGTVLLDDEPIEGATVTFVPVNGGRPATAVTESDGGFELSTKSPGDGAIIGTHLVGIQLIETESNQTVGEDGLEGSATATDAPPKVTWIVPEKYATPKTSGLTATVPADEPLRFELNSD